MRVDLKPTMEELALDYACREYGAHDLQKVGVWQFKTQTQQPKQGRWIVYIHGGAWRDPKVTHTSFLPTINHLVKSGHVSPDSIAGFASIDYRLSPHPDHPQDRDNTPESSLRNAQHPDHINDVQSALKFLKKEYGVGDDYILIGHSAGATLAFQLLMDQPTKDADSNPPLPSTILGVSGIYDLVSLDDRHKGNYAGFITAAFGSDKKVWDDVSPVHFTGSFRENWPSSRLAILAWSPEDTLIDEPEIKAMAAKLLKDRVNVNVTQDLTGDHNEVWEEGSQLAQLVHASLALERVDAKE